MLRTAALQLTDRFQFDSLKGPPRGASKKPRVRLLVRRPLLHDWHQLGDERHRTRTLALQGVNVKLALVAARQHAALQPQPRAWNRDSISDLQPRELTPAQATQTKDLHNRGVPAGTDRS